MVIALKYAKLLLTVKVKAWGFINKSYNVVSNKLLVKSLNMMVNTLFSQNNPNVAPTNYLRKRID